MTSSGALLNKLEEYVDSAMEKNENVDRKVLDALLAAINIQVRELAMNLPLNFASIAKFDPYLEHESSLLVLYNLTM